MNGRKKEKLSDLFCKSRDPIAWKMHIMGVFHITSLGKDSFENTSTAGS